MGVSILNATFGDNIARRDVTQSIKDKTQSGNVEVTANEDLIPAFEVSQETKLDNSELAQITKQAQEQCNGGADSACMQATKAKLMQEKHAQKAQADTSSANIIAGRSLAVTYMDDKNRVKRVVVPDGQKFKLDNVAFANKAGQIERPSLWEPVQKAFGDALGIIWWTFLFVFSVGAAYRVFKIYGNMVLAIFIASLAIILPLGGFSPQVGIYMIVLIYGFIEMGRMSKDAAAKAAAAPPPSSLDPLQALAGSANPINSVLGGLKGANPLAALQGARANPMAALGSLGSFLGKR